MRYLILLMLAAVVTLLCAGRGEVVASPVAACPSTPYALAQAGETCVIPHLPETSRIATPCEKPVAALLPDANADLRHVPAGPGVAPVVSRLAACHLGGGVWRPPRAFV